jgi:crossover junction endodeoxyribonuclease RuvC
MRIIGIDPGLRCLGWGVIDAVGSRLSHVANGQCRSEGADLATRLVSLHRQLTDLVETYRPDAASIEMTFVNRDGAGTLKLGQARGVAVLVPASAGIPVAEYAPNAVKKTIVGAGHADKRQIDHMVRMQLPGAAPVGPDAADALALALCHAFHARGSDRLAQALGKSGAVV